MDRHETSLLWRLQTTLEELECEFHYVLCDVNMDREHLLRERPAVMHSLRRAAQSVAAAAIALRGAPTSERNGLDMDIFEPNRLKPTAPPDPRLISMYEAAAQNLSDGLSMFDEGRRLVFCNERYATIYELPPQLTEPGAKYDDIANYRLHHGTEPLAARQFFAQHAALLKEQSAGVVTATLGNGRTVVVRHQPMPDGGWVATHNDITGQTPQA